MAVARTLCPNRASAASRAIRSSRVLPLDGYGVARDTRLAFQPDVGGLVDLGVAPASERIDVTMVLRATETVAHDEPLVRAALVAAGFKIEQTYPNQLVVAARAPASIASAFFRTTIDDFEQGQFGRRYANVIPATLPASIAPFAFGVILDNLIIARPPHNESTATRVFASRLRFRIERRGRSIEPVRNGNEVARPRLRRLVFLP